MEKNSRNETPNISRLDRKRDENKRRTLILPHVKNKRKKENKITITSNPS